MLPTFEYSIPKETFDKMTDEEKKIANNFQDFISDPERINKEFSESLKRVDALLEEHKDDPESVKSLLALKTVCQSVIDIKDPELKKFSIIFISHKLAERYQDNEDSLCCSQN